MIFYRTMMITMAIAFALLVVVFNLSMAQLVKSRKPCTCNTKQEIKAIPGNLLEESKHFLVLED